MLTVTNISAIEAKKIKYLSNEDVLISINNPYEPLHELSINRKDPRVLTTVFADVTSKYVSATDCYEPITGEQAKEIVEFVKKYEKKNFLVHCTAGISRSGAVAMFIHQVYGHKLKDRFWFTSYPNPYVLGKLYLLHEHMLEG